MSGKLAGMPNQRSYTDDELQAAISEALCWSDVAERLGKGRSGNVTWPRKRASLLGLDINHLDRYPGSMIVAESPDLPFHANPVPVTSGRLGLSTAISWFLSRGYAPSIPVEPCLYDLVVESDCGLQRIQVKTTGRKTSEGRYHALIGRAAYDSKVTANARGRFRREAYPDGSIDFFFIVCANGAIYLIPQSRVSGLIELTLTRKYVAFLVQKGENDDQ